MDYQKLETAAIIIGSGPTGATTSLFLTKARVPHIVIDTNTSELENIIGCAFSYKSHQVFDKVNPDWIHELLKDKTKSLPVWGIKVSAPNSSFIDIPFELRAIKNALAPAYSIPRSDFNHFMHDKMQSAYCRHFTNAEIKKMDINSGKVNLEMVCGDEEYSITGRVIVGADGDESIVRKNFIPKSTLGSIEAIGLRAYYEGVTGMNRDNYIELHFIKELSPGYLWIFPMPDGITNVGARVPESWKKNKKHSPDEQFANLIKGNTLLSERFSNANMVGPMQKFNCPSLWQQQPISGDHFILVGEAAALGDNFSGEGIGNSLISGMLAAEAIKKAEQQKNYTKSFFHDLYDKTLFENIGEEISISTNIRKWVKYPAVLNHLVKKANNNPDFRTSLNYMLTDPEQRKPLQKPWFYIKLLLGK